MIERLNEFPWAIYDRSGLCSDFYEDYVSSGFDDHATGTMTEDELLTLSEEIDDVTQYSPNQHEDFLEQSSDGYGEPHKRFSTSLRHSSQTYIGLVLLKIRLVTQGFDLSEQTSLDHGLHPLRANAPANWSRSSANPPTDNTAWYSLGYVRDTTSLVSSCCQSPAAIFTPREPSINTTDPGLKNCFTYCNITEPGLTVESVFTCVEDALKLAGIDGGYAEMSVNQSKVEPIASGTVVIPTVSQMSRVSQTAVAEGGAMRLGRAAGWVVLGLTVVGAVGGI